MHWTSASLVKAVGWSSIIASMKSRRSAIRFGEIGDDRLICRKLTTATASV